MSSDGAVVVSLDFELSWGSHGLGGTPDVEEQRRENVVRLLDLFEDLDAPVTWAVVGHLFLDRCDGVHADMARPYGPLGDTWYDVDPGTSLSADPSYYARDLVTQIRDSAVKHEIGTHTFSHILCDQAGRDTVARELNYCQELASALGVDLRSLVFPQNRVGHLDAVSQAGIEVFRGVGRETVLRHERVAGRYRKYARFLTQRPYRPVTPERVRDGLWRLPGSMYLPYNPLDPELNEFFPTHPRVTRAIKSITLAQERSGIFHLWAHPRNFDDRMFRDLRAILEHARDIGVPIRTMYDATMGHREVSPV